MKHSCLQTFLSSSEETEEPWPKKLKIDRSYVSSEMQQSELLERLCYIDKKPSSKPLSFPVISWNFNQIGLELQGGNNRNLTPNLRQGTLFKPHVNLQSRLVESISFTEKWTLESKDSSIIKKWSSFEFNTSHNSLATKSDSWDLPAKEREKSIYCGDISKENELPALNTVFYNVLPGNLIAEKESLSTDGPEFQNNEYGTACHQVYDILRPYKQYIPKPLSYGENNNSQIQYLCSPASSFMKGAKSNLRSLLYEYKCIKNVNYKKQTNFSENHYFRKNKVFQHIYIPYSRNSKVINPKLVKCAAFELFLQDMRLYNYSTSAERNHTTIFSQIIVLNAQERKISNEKCTKECLTFSRDTIKDCIFSVAGNKEEQMTKLIPSNNQILPDNNFPSSTLGKENLCNPKLMYSLTANFGPVNCLTSFPIIFEKSSFKHSGTQTVVMQKENGKTSQENSVLKQYNKHGKFRNTINFISKSKYVPNYTGTCKRPLMNKNKYSNCEDGQETPCGIVDKQAHFSCFDTFQKICLSAEEVDEIYFIDNIIFHAEKNEKYSTVYTATDKRICESGSSTSNHSCVPSELLTNQNYFLEQGIRGERSHCPKDISQFPHHEINNVTFPINSLVSGNIFNFFTNVHPYFTSVISHDLIDQSIVSVNGWCSKIVIHGKRGKQNSFAFEKNQGVIRYQSLCNSRFYNSLKHHKVEVESKNLHLQKDILLSNTHNSDEISVKQNAQDIDKIENVITEQSHRGKRNQLQNLTVSYMKDKSTQYVEDKSTILSSTTKQQHFDDTAEEHFSLNPQLVNKSYEFEMKNHFDLVLKELHMFNEISKENSKENENNLACGERDEINKENSKENENSFTYLEREMIEKDLLVPSHCEMLDKDSKTFCENKVNVSYSVTGITVSTARVQQNKNEQCSLKDTVLQRPGEQEVPHESFVSSTSDEELFYSPCEEHCSSWYKQPLTWNPAFVPHSFTEERSFSYKIERGKCFLDGIIRVQPLKTCHRPLRVGLSRRAKLRHLHPYLK